jgi:hypothetical protein
MYVIVEQVYPLFVLNNLKVLSSEMDQAKVVSFDNSLLIGEARIFSAP